jgi:hypothetical protein
VIASIASHTLTLWTLFCKTLFFVAHNIRQQPFEFPCFFKHDQFIIKFILLYIFLFWCCSCFQHMHFPTHVSYFLIFFVNVIFFLQTSLNILHTNMFQSHSNLVIICSILVCFGHDMTKTNTFINLLKFQRMMINNKMYCYGHRYQVVDYIFHKSNHMKH